MGLPYKLFKRRHREYLGSFWRRCHAFYAGGQTLLGDDALLKDVFPMHMREREDIYRERVTRAYYVPYAGEVIDHIVSGLFGSGLTMTAEPEAPPFYAEFFDDVTAPGGSVMPYDRFLRCQILEALKCKRAWTLVDLPSIDGTLEPESAADEERLGLDRAYLVKLDPESVINWAKDGQGRLVRVLVCSVDQEWQGLEQQNDQITETYTYYDWRNWKRWAITYDPQKPPQPSDEVPEIASGAHSFGAVPIECLDLPEGLWAMGKLESLARMHFNESNMLAWGHCKSLLPVRYEFLAPEIPMVGMPISEAQQDPSRGVNQTVGQGYVQTRGHQDRAEYVGPDSSPYGHVLEYLKFIRDEMHRVVHMMALSVDNTASTMRRSGESKAHDKAAMSVVLNELGTYVSTHARSVVELVAKGRKDPDLVWTVHGLDNFDAMDVSTAIEEFVQLSTVKTDIPSPTYWRLKASELARVSLSPETPREELDEIDKELESNVDAETFESKDEPDGDEGQGGRPILPTPKEVLKGAE